MHGKRAIQNRRGGDGATRAPASKRPRSAYKGASVRPRAAERGADAVVPVAATTVGMATAMPTPKSDIELLPDDCLWSIAEHMGPAALVAAARCSRRLADAFLADPVWFRCYAVAAYGVRSWRGMRFPPFTTRQAPAFRPLLAGAAWLHRFRDAARSISVAVYGVREAQQGANEGGRRVSANLRCVLRLRRYDCDSRRLTLTVAALLDVGPFGFDLWRIVPDEPPREDTVDRFGDGAIQGALLLGRLTTSGARQRLSPSVPAWMLVTDDADHLRVALIEGRHERLLGITPLVPP